MHPPPADAAALVKKLGDSASLDAEDKAVLVIACQPNLSAKDCQDGLTNLADPKNFKNFPKIPEMWCDEDCLTAHATLLTDKSELDFSKLPDPKIRDEVRTAIAAADPKNFLGLSTKLAFNDHEAEAKALVLALCLDEKGEFSKKCVERSDSIAKFDATKDQELQKIVEAAQKTANAAKANSEFLRAALSAAEKDQNLASDEPVARISDRLERVRRARCATAYCWGGHDGRRSAIEPILDLPVGMYWATSGSSLANYINANNIKIQFNAGLRYWFAYDAMSIGILLAQPDLTETQSTIDFRNKSLPKSQVRRPYPTLVLGFVGDILQLSLSYDELRNAPSNSENHLPEYPSNGVLARALTFGVAISPLTAARNGIGASIGAKEESK